jgi:L-seryl-tRNA(Ser) seleniumtransferase
VDEDAAVLRALPPAHAVLGHPAVRALGHPRDATRALLAGVLDAMRASLRAGVLAADRTTLTALAAEALVEAVGRARQPAWGRVINATGVVLHTNLGRAPLGRDAVSRMADAVEGYTALEFDLSTGRRGHRDSALGPRLCGLVGAEDALVVNNCAAAVLLACTALAAGKAVLVSRGELVEIGGGFRIPDVIASCGARLVEVGTTNRTRLADYARAMGPDVGAVLRVHRSNFVVRGFTEEAPREGLAALARSAGVPFVEDLGSGALVDTRALNLPHEPTPREALAAGVDLVLWSGDKLLGGPQAGLVAGTRSVVGILRRHPLMRALRPGRLVLAALDAVLQRYADGTATETVPVLAALGAPVERVRARAEALLRAVYDVGPLPAGVSLAVVDSEGRVGGGTLPEARVASAALRVTGVSPHALAATLRAGAAGAVPVVARVGAGALWLDARTVDDAELSPVAEALRAALGALARGAGVAQTPGDVAETLHDERADEGEEDG